MCRDCGIPRFSRPCAAVAGPRGAAGSKWTRQAFTALLHLPAINRFPPGTGVEVLIAKLVPEEGRRLRPSVAEVCRWGSDVLDGVSLELYRFAVATPGWTLDEASTALGYTTRKIEGAVAELLESRLLELPKGHADTYVAVSPEIALADLVDEDERSLQELRSRINAKRREMTALLPEYAAARKEIATDPSVEVLEDPAVVRRVLIEYGRDVTEQVLIAMPGQGSNAEAHEASIRKDRDLLARGVVRKNLYDNSTRDHMPTRKAVAALSPDGVRFRTLPFVPVRLLIFDQKLALVSRQLEPDDHAALVVRDINLIRIFNHLYEVAWELAEPYTPEEEAKATKLNSTQQSILQGLAAGYSDEVIARRLNISVRTCRRHIAWMLEELGAESRFQAGMKAHEAGWI
jgi:DNA-binding CsgD family transcriptional regulator/sugar-specific transcriptional regulator TrmB